MVGQNVCFFCCLLGLSTKCFDNVPDLLFLKSNIYCKTRGGLRDKVLSGNGKGYQEIGR